MKESAAWEKAKIKMPVALKSVVFVLIFACAFKFHKKFHTQKFEIIFSKSPLKFKMIFIRF